MSKTSSGPSGCGRIACRICGTTCVFWCAFFLQHKCSTQTLPSTPVQPGFRPESGGPTEGSCSLASLSHGGPRCSKADESVLQFSMLGQPSYEALCGAAKTSGSTSGGRMSHFKTCHVLQVIQSVIDLTKRLFQGHPEGGLANVKLGHRCRRVAG